MYKLVAIDIDGTLLNSDGKIPKENIEAVKAAKENRAKVILASRKINSGRWSGIAKELGSGEFLIAGNGSFIYNMEEKEVVYTNYLSKEKILKIIDVCEENSIFYSIFTTDTMITKSLRHNMSYYSHEHTLEDETNIRVVDNMYEFIKNYEKDDFLKITICDDNKIIFSRIMNKLKEIEDIDVLDVGHMSRKTIESEGKEVEIAYFYTEITNKNANKWTALEYLINELGIDRGETIGIGDNVNDKELIQNAGVGVAMGHSYPELKQMADYVAGDNNSKRSCRSN